MHINRPEILINEKNVVFRFIFEGKLFALEFSPEEARSFAQGLMKASVRLQPTHKLYAIATEVLERTDSGMWRWVPGGVEYLHAENEGDARLKFHRARSSKQTIKVVACAPAISSSEGG